MIAMNNLENLATAIGTDIKDLKTQTTNSQTKISANTEAIDRIATQMNSLATKSEVKQDIDGLTQTFSKMKIGGTNLLKGSKGPFMPDRKPANFDNNVLYAGQTSIYMEQGQEYIISAKTDGTFTAHHDGNKESDNVVLWIMDKNVRNYQIVSDLKTGTTGTKFVWNKLTGIYHLRVNTYHKEATKSVWDVKIEKGNVATDWSPAPEDAQTQVAETQESLRGLERKFETIASDVKVLNQKPEPRLTLTGNTLGIAGGNNVTLPPPENVGHEIRGTGFPEGRITAEIGTTYVDVNATNGALKWIKESRNGNTGWKVLIGDTGWRTLNALSLATVNNKTSEVKIRRVNNLVSFMFGGLDWGFFGIIRRGGKGFAGFQRDTQALILGSGGIPIGFRSEASLVGSLYLNFESTGIWYLGGKSDGHYMLLDFINQIPTTNDITNIRFSSISYLTDDPWPTTLP